MHEASIATYILNAIVKYSKNRKVKLVKLEVGEFVVLNIEQLLFVLNALKRSISNLKNAKFEVELVEGIVKCSECGYEGKSLKDSHIALPICPKCYEKAEILRGNELKIREITLS